MKRRLKRIGLCAGGLVGLLLAFVIEEHARGRHGLNAYLSRMEANGEVCSVAALEPKHPPAGQNVFVDLIQLAGQLEPMVKHLNDAPPSLRFATPGKEIVAWRLNKWGYNGIITNDWSRLGPELDAARELLDMVHRSVQKPFYDSGFDYKKGDIRGFLWLTHSKSVEDLKKRDELIGWKWWAGHRLSLFD